MRNRHFIKSVALLALLAVLFSSCAFAETVAAEPLELPTGVVEDAAPSEADMAFTGEPAPAEDASEPDGEGAAQELEEFEIPAEDDLQDSSEPAAPLDEPEERSFESGYVLIAAGTALYEDADATVLLGTIVADSPVYAEVERRNDDPQMEVLRVCFDTADDRAAGAAITEAYAYYADVLPLNADETQWLLETMAGDEGVREKDGVVVPCAAYQPLDDARALRMDGEGEVLAGTVTGLDVASRTQAEIQAFVDAHPANVNQIALYRRAATMDPYAPALLSQVNQQSVLNMVNQIRYICGLNANVTLANEKEPEMAAAAFVNALNNVLSHYPSRPSVLTDSAYDTLYAQAQSGASSANIARGIAVTDTILAYMSDSDSSNIDRVGHRRWIINPTMSRTVQGSFGNFSALYAHDRNGAGGQNRVAWPAQVTPIQYFDANDAWSVSFSRALTASAIRVELTRASDGKVWNFSSTGSDGYFNINNAGYGLYGCVIFRPSALGSLSDGDTFTVTITDSAFDETTQYTVRFFNLDTSKANALQSPNLTAVNATAGINLSWSAVSGASGYYVYRADADHDFEIVADVADTSYVDASVTEGVEYTYYIFAHSSSVTSGAASNAREVLTRETPQHRVTAITYPQTHAMDEGTSATLPITVTPADAADTVRYVSSNRSVATVDALTGEITALFAGTTTITAVAGDVSASCVLTVREIPITSMAFQRGQVDLEMGWRTVLFLDYQPENASPEHITFTSSDPRVVDVDAYGLWSSSGDGTAGVWAASRGFGTAVVTATAPSGLSRSCTVTVRSATHPLNLTLKTGETFTPSATVSGTTFVSSNDSVATVDPSTGAITGRAAGTATITGTQNGAVTVLCHVTVESVPNKYRIDTTDALMNNKARVVLVEGALNGEQLYVRIDFIYENEEGLTLAVPTREYVEVASDGAMTFDIAKPSAPYGYRITEVQFALVTDSSAHTKMEYDGLAFAKVAA